MDDFAGKVALVTGGASGIGRASAILYAKQGAKVMVSDVNDDGGKETVRYITDNGGAAHYFRCNVASPEECETLVQSTVNHFGHLDVACNAAGIGGDMGRTAQHGIESWQRVIEINLNGVFYCMKYQLTAMLTGGGGVIVNISSVLGMVSSDGSPAYVAAKHGVIGLTQNAAVEYATKNIRVNAVGPGFIQTPMIKFWEENPRIKEAVLAQHPIGRMGTPEEVAEMVIWLSSDKASFVTGGFYAVDGGFLAR